MKTSFKTSGPRAAKLAVAAVLSISPLIAQAVEIDTPVVLQSATQAVPNDLPAAWPESLGVDSRQLVEMSKWIRKQNLDVRSLLVVKDGKVIFERYSKGLTRNHNYELYSITKNVTALAAGALIDQGRTRLDEKIAPVLSKIRPDLIQAFTDKQSITLRHVMSMSTGLFYNFQPTDDPIYYGAPDRLKLAAQTTPKRPPGEEFEYTDVNPILASATLSADAGMPLEKFSEQTFFKPMGMKNYSWDRADDKGLVSAGWGLRLRPVDMAKLGLLVLSGGRWNDRQLVSQAWV
ncbi:MAG: class C beta-lactamase-related serine hydrolase, partial [Oxalobacteraceae bacterium]